ncbi:MAG: SDR family oxidoreductase [Polyangiaceae bacterium]
MTTMITGATGTIGSQVTEVLLTKGAKDLVVTSRRLDALDKWKERGAKVAAVDLLEPNRLGDAFRGVDQLFLLSPQVPDFGERLPAIYEIAKASGVKHIVRFGALGANPDADFIVARQHGLADEALRNSGLAFTILQPTFFQENFVTFQGDAIRSQGAFYGSSGDGATAYVSGRDLAAAAAGILQAPERHAGETYVLTGPDAHRDAEVARLISEVTGREIRYVDLPAEHMRAGMIERGMPEWLADSLVGLEGVKRKGWASEVSPSLAQLLDHEPETLRSFLERNRGKLA